MKKQQSCIIAVLAALVAVAGCDLGAAEPKPAESEAERRPAADLRKFASWRRNRWLSNIPPASTKWKDVLS